MKLKYITLLPAIILMVAIYIFSSKPAVTSNEGSMVIAENILTIYENITTTNYQETQRVNLLESINHIVRKSCHFCEYALLAMCFSLHLFVLGKRNFWLYVLPIVLSAAYASTDEYHQTFVPGRSGQWKDVLLDSSGAVAGVILFTIGTFVILQLFKNYKGRLHNSKTI